MPVMLPTARDIMVDPARFATPSVSSAADHVYGAKGLVTATFVQTN